MSDISRPNILWICTDQQRWDTLGCYGNPYVHTPHIDRLASEGVLFERCFSQSPVCTPSRASFLTGRYPRTTRCRQNGQDIPDDEVLVTRLLADAGYVCGLAGKLHLSACNPSVTPEMEPRIDDGYEVFHWSHDTHPGWPTNAYYNWLKDHGQTYEAQPHPESRWVQIGPPEAWHQTTWCADRAIEFMEKQGQGDAPWLFSVNMFDPHHAFDAPEAYLARYMDHLDDLPLPDYVEGELDNKPWFQAYDHAGAYGHQAGLPFPEMTDREHRLVKASYFAMCDLIDVQVGRMFKALRTSNQLKNTLVIFMSDHGEMLGDHGIYLKGPYFYEPAIRVPMIIAQPGRIRPQHSEALIELTDLAQTLLDAADVPHHPGMQGRSLWPLLCGETDIHHHRDDVYCEYYNAMPWHQNPTAQTTMTRTDRYKITVDHTTGRGELYDLESDPSETHNLWDDDRGLSIKVDMLTRLCHRMAGTVDPLPPRRAAW